MSDIKTVWKIDSGGWVSETGDLTSGDDLDTAIFISLQISKRGQMIPTMVTIAAAGGVIWAKITV